MDTGQYSTLMDALKDIPDPRKPRGKRHPWQHLLLVLLAGLASAAKPPVRLPTGHTCMPTASCT